MVVPNAIHSPSSCMFKMAQDLFVGLLFVLCFSAAYSASGAMDNFSIKPDNQKHVTDIKLVSFVPYCWEGLSITPHMYQVVNPSLLFFTNCRMTVLYARSPTQPVEELTR